MGCKYIYNYKVYTDYRALIEDLSEGDIENALSILYSLDTEKLTKLVDKLTSIKLDYKFNNTQSVIDGDPDIAVDRSKFTTLTFIDSALFSINGEPPMFRLDMDEYLTIMRDRLVQKDGLTELEAELKVSGILKNWNRIAKDSSDLHRIIVSSNYKNDDRHFSGSAINTSFTGIYDLLGNVVRLIEKDIYKLNKNSTLLRNLNIEADIRGVAEKIIGHVDYLFVKDNGDIEIFNIKSSIESESEWGAVKLEKFRYLLALIKRILEFNGIDARHIKVNLIPVKIKYDDAFLNVIEITASDAKSYDSRDSTYIFQKYDNIAALFINSNAEIEDLDDNIFIAVNQYLLKIFPKNDVNIRSNGIKESAKGWVKHHWRSIATQSSNGKKGWEIKLPGDKEAFHIEDTRVGEDNKELIDIVIDREEELFRNTSLEKATYRVISDILRSFRYGLKFFSSSFKGGTSSLLNIQLNKYYESVGTLADGTTPDYKWELIENDTLTNANIILFRHKVTNLLDVINITPFDVSLKSNVNGRTHILGNYLPNLNDRLFTLLANYGNIEAVRTLTLLNEIVPKLPFKPLLGQLKVIGLSQHHNKKGAEYELGSLLLEFDTIVSVVNENNLGLNMPNNFKSNNTEVIEPSRLFIQTWKEAIADNPSMNMSDLKELEGDITQKIKTTGMSIDGLESVLTIEGKIEKLEIIVDKLKVLAQNHGISNPKSLKEAMKSSNLETAAIAKVYSAALRALNIYNGDLSIDNEEFSQMLEYLVKTLSIVNSNVRIVGYMFLKSIDKIANTVLDRYSPIREVIMKYYKDTGYTATLNSLVGNLTSLFKNLYELDIITGEKTMRFKNPYDLSSDLKSHERLFLKDILWEFNKIRYEMRGLTWDYSSRNDSRLILDIENRKNNYLDVPLERASSATRRTNIKAGIKDFGKRWMKRILHPKDAFKEFSEDSLNENDRRILQEDISNLSAYNPFLRSENPNRRDTYINELGIDYFETNVENIMVDFLEKHILSVEYNKMLTRTKGILLDLYLKGDGDNDEKNITHTVKTIEDFLSVNVFNKSIMEESSLALESYLEPIRRAVSKCYIAANPAAAVRDTILGLLENTVKALIKFLTDIDVKDVMYGYKEIITEGVGNLMTINKYNLLNVKYRFSNLDVARISEGLKTGRGGILNAENWAYSTLRAPDYLNRMVLFSAKMHHDGVDKAYNIVDSKLLYDWKLDKRFSAYSTNDTSNMESYTKQRSLYLSLLRIFNLENGTKLTEGDTLPDAYTLAQITSFKTFADNIYGSYNLSTRAKYENIAIGRNFAVFSTWMNGIVDVYGKLKLLSRSESEWKLDKNSSGQLLYFDRYGNAKTLEEGGDSKTPVMKDVPIMVLGCWYTLVDAFRALLYGGWDTLKSDIWSNEVLRRNIKRMISDLLVAFLLGAMFKFFVTPTYKEHKATGNGKDFMTNAITEIVYNASSSSFDGFKGPYAVLEYLGNSTNPATYKLLSKILNDLGGFLFGDKTFQQLLIGSLALPRSMNDSYQMWVRDTQK